jgi:uncharacterized membrane protein YfcA
MNIVYYIKCFFIGIITGALNGLFGSGGGTIVVPAMVRFLDIDQHKAHATAISIILPLTIVSSIFYIKGHFADWNLILKTSVGGIAGGYVGAKLLKVIPSKYLSKIFGAFMIFASIRMVFFS